MKIHGNHKIADAFWEDHPRIARSSLQLFTAAPDKVSRSRARPSTEGSGGSKASPQALLNTEVGSGLLPKQFQKKNVFLFGKGMVLRHGSN